MEYSKKEIKKGVNIHYINTDLFKTDLISIFLTKRINRDNVTYNTLIPAVLTSGSKNMKSQEEINKAMENLYGAEMDCGIQKIGDNQVLKFYIESINNKYVLTNENLIEEVINKLFEIVFEPYLENGQFKKEYVDKEKIKIQQLIEGKIDNKGSYATERMIEEMYKNESYGLYKYGYVEDLEKISSKDLYDEYINLLKTAKIDIVISGDFLVSAVEKIIMENHSLKLLEEREPDYVVNNETTEVKKEKKENVIEESLDIAQGKLVIGMDIMDNTDGIRYALGLYNMILGGSANSKLFQNVREKESLAYFIGSKYLKQKNNIIITAGIEMENYEKACILIKKEVEDIKNGNFTEDDVKKAKKMMNYAINSINEEQENGVNYYITQELSGNLTTIEEYLERINNLTKDDVVNIAKKIKINTIYFLKN